MRLGVYTDTLYRLDGETLSNSRAFTRFITSLPPRVDEVVLFGRVAPEPGRADYALPATGLRFVELPHYPRITAVGAMVRAARGSARAFAAELGELDAVWVFGPHPMALLFAAIARRRGVPLVLGVRQDYPVYIAHRLPGRSWRWAVPAARLLDRAFRRLARRAPAVVVGADLARRYQGGAPVLASGFSLVGAADLVDERAALGRDWSSRIELLSVGRLDPEKNPLLLVDVMAGLESRAPGRWHLTVVGDGPVREELAQAAAARGLTDALELAGEVTNGAELWSYYRASHAFLHVSLTEGVPQVLFEAAAAGLPIVATSVGGVADALRGGELGLLVAPRDADAAVEALLRLHGDAELRERLIRDGLGNARAETMEAQLDRIAAFLRSSLGGRAASAAVTPPSASSSHR